MVKVLSFICTCFITSLSYGSLNQNNQNIQHFDLESQHGALQHAIIHLDDINNISADTYASNGQYLIKKHEKDIQNITEQLTLHKKTLKWLNKERKTLHDSIELLAENTEYLREKFISYWQQGRACHTINFVLSVAAISKTIYDLVS